MYVHFVAKLAHSCCLLPQLDPEIAVSQTEAMSAATNKRLLHIVTISPYVSRTSHSPQKVYDRVHLRTWHRLKKAWQASPPSMINDDVCVDVLVVERCEADWSGLELLDVVLHIFLV